MSSPDEASAALQSRTLRRLYLTLMFRARRTAHAKPRLVSPVTSFWLSAGVFALFGFLAFGFWGQPMIAYSSCLHAMTFLLIGMNLATTSGSLLFNAEEVDVLLHRPVRPRALLIAKVRVIVLVSLVLALAMNLIGLVVGVARPAGTWLFVPAHLCSLALEVVFCVSFVVLAYNLCLKWFGRERLENLITTVQVLVAVAAMIAGQVVPRLTPHLDSLAVSAAPWWVVLLPPVWFGALDAALTGQSLSAAVLGLAGGGIVITGLTTWLGVHRLAATYEQGLVMLNEAGPGAVRSGTSRGRVISCLLRMPLIRRWLADPAERAAFRLTAFQLARARGVKLRVYPLLAQLSVLPIVMFVSSARSRSSNFEPFVIAYVGTFVAMIPMMVLDRLRFADDWLAADLFRQVPLRRLSALFHGTRKAVILCLCAPILLLIVALGFACVRPWTELLLLLPGLLCLPVFSLLAGVSRVFLPFAEPPEVEAQSGRGCLFLALFTISSFAVAGLSGWAWEKDWFGWLLTIEMVLVFAAGKFLRHLISCHDPDRRHALPMQPVGRCGRDTETS